MRVSKQVNTMIYVRPGVAKNLLEIHVIICTRESLRIAYERASEHSS